MSNVLLQNICKSYPGCLALDDVSLEIHEGEFMTLLGASGSGKTTLLNAIAGTVVPDSGSIEIGGLTMDGVEPRKRGLGMVFQSYALVPHMTVAENIAFPLKIRRIPAREIERRVQSILEVVQLGALAKRKPRELSGGQQQRVAIARCLVYEPPVILMDEPLGALDKKLRDQLQREIRRIHRETRVTIIYVTHDQEEALFLSDRICLMRSGRIEQLGTPQDLYHRPKNVFVADFLGESNLLRCTPGPDSTATVVGGQCILLAAGRDEDRPTPAGARLLIRPDRLEFMDSPREGHNVLQGRISEVTFVGEVSRVTLQVGDETIIVKARPKPDSPAFETGRTAMVGWKPEDSLLVAADSAVAPLA